MKTYLKIYLQTIVRHIENDPWDEVIERGDRYFIYFCWFMIVFAILYFGIGVIRGMG